MKENLKLRCYCNFENEQISHATTHTTNVLPIRYFNFYNYIYIYFKNKYGSMLGASGNVLEISVKQKLYVFNKKMLNLQNILVRVADLLDDDLAVSISVSLSSLAL